MLTPFPSKSPRQMRREAERRGRPRPAPLPEPDPSLRPIQSAEDDRELDATIEWLAHIETGRIGVR